MTGAATIPAGASQSDLPSPYELGQRVPGHGFPHETVETDAPGLDDVALSIPSGHRDQEHVTVLWIRSETPPELKAVHHRHCQVTQDDIGLAAGDLHQAFAPLGGEHYAERLNTPIPR